MIAKKNTTLIIPSLPHLSDSIIHDLFANNEAPQRLVIGNIQDFYGNFNPSRNLAHLPQLQLTSLTKPIREIPQWLLQLPIVSGLMDLFLSKLILSAVEVLAGTRKKWAKNTKKELLESLEKLQPDVIITFSDQNLFTYLILGSEFEDKLKIIQPALITFRQRGLTDRFIYGMAALANEMEGIKSRPEKINWGETSKLATLCLWSQLEEANRFASKNLIVTGTKFIRSAPSITYEPSAPVLIILPNLSKENASYRTKYVSELEMIFEALPHREFLLKNHPSDSYVANFEFRKNVVQIDDSFDLNTNLSHIISSRSALAVSIRISFRNVIIFDFGRFKKINVPYFSDQFFSFADTHTSVIEMLSRAGGAPASDAEDSFQKLFLA